MSDKPRMTRTVPALPASDMAAAVEHDVGRSGFHCRHRVGGFAVVVRGATSKLAYDWHIADQLLQTRWGHHRGRSPKPLAATRSCCTGRR